MIFVNDKGVAKMVEVKTGISDYDNIEILSGIAMTRNYYRALYGGIQTIERRRQGKADGKKGAGKKRN